MYVIPELRLNDFELVQIPSAKDLFRRFGGTSPKVGNSDSLNFAEPANGYDSLNKMDAMAQAQQLRMEEGDLPEDS